MSGIMPGGSHVLNPATGEYEYAYRNKADGKYYRTLVIGKDGEKQYSGPIVPVKTPVVEQPKHTK